ncbi:MAG: bifunctional phosphoribosylaminoimidazolecarboxamide formyltransferase/IMP cyclohydrolase [Candidatus Binatus sp.]|uniref:bifunctional phosphoribosylaminoimidazolecarboxamide formyltransferase/IMP cyclohydrolase n=1 Tax=Candidatus Binatus sp. TaxID=2811406 RepID=UPI002728C3E5|nr:bifunctional phosphoribosylaminoimidazolecarboxamide formyltransferase/IMP cyclohydrolase [Candidatus Binatus sp.]MDO8434332.1 bifunctional phosphoribosylaminoimidazolecarboxamide formyltransferase/IMP cyclohydrolase [Candidatus Binatus sp.]
MNSNDGAIKRALLGVSNKDGLDKLARALERHGVEILSTGGTMAALQAAGVKVRAVENFTGSPEMFDGRVKTLHPKLHGGILARRDDVNHQRQMRENSIEPIDLVVVNFYPFEQTVAKAGVTLEDAIENIDIGGPALVRSAAKNHRDVTVVVDPADYPAIVTELDSNRGAISAETRWRLARKAFARVAAYDAAIANYLGTHAGADDSSPLGETFNLSLPREQALRYGENPHQTGALYGRFHEIAHQLHGKELSFNNVVDISSAINLMLEFQAERRAVVAILKHNTPCGVGVGDTLKGAWDKAFATDPDSPFGGIIISNRAWDLEFARAVDELFTEVLIGPEYPPEVIEFLRKKKNRRVMTFHPEAVDRSELDLKKVLGGLLVQTPDLAIEDPRQGKIVTRRAPTGAELDALTFGIKVCKHIKSNAIAFVGADRTLAVGGGATSRIDPVYAAREKATRLKVSLEGSVLVSEALFPFPDGPTLAAEAGATAIAQPGGAVRDDEVIAAADKYGLAMVFTGVRHFRH